MKIFCAHMAKIPDLSCWEGGGTGIPTWQGVVTAGLWLALVLKAKFLSFGPNENNIS